MRSLTEKTSSVSLCDFSISTTFVNNFTIGLRSSSNDSETFQRSLSRLMNEYFWFLPRKGSQWQQDRWALLRLPREILRRNEITRFEPFEEFKLTILGVVSHEMHFGCKSYGIQSVLASSKVVLSPMPMNAGEDVRKFQWTAMDHHRLIIGKFEADFHWVAGVSDKDRRRTLGVPVDDQRIFRSGQSIFLVKVHRALMFAIAILANMIPVPWAVRIFLVIREYRLKASIVRL